MAGGRSAERGADGPTGAWAVQNRPRAADPSEVEPHPRAARDDRADRPLPRHPARRLPSALLGADGGTWARCPPGRPTSGDSAVPVVPARPGPPEGRLRPQGAAGRGCGGRHGPALVGQGQVRGAQARVRVARGRGPRWRVLSLCSRTPGRSSWSTCRAGRSPAAVQSSVSQAFVRRVATKDAVDG
jgi:hypothetical protein